MGVVLGCTNRKSGPTGFSPKRLDSSCPGISFPEALGSTEAPATHNFNSKLHGHHRASAASDHANHTGKD